MAATIKNQASAANATVVATLVTKLTQGFPAKLGTIAVANDAVQFVVPEPSRDHQGVLVIMVGNGITIGTGVLALEASLDGGTSFFEAATVTTADVADFTDTAASAHLIFNASGFGAGALFRFGIKTLGTLTGSAPVWALVG